MQLIVEPKVVKSWRDFKATTPYRSIALDGYVSEGPRFSYNGPWINFNHHAGVSRLETRATCAQVLLAIRQGLIDHLWNVTDGVDNVRIYVNDCDEDVCLSVFLLQDYKYAQETNPLLNRLVFMEDMLDTTGGTYIFDENLESLHQLLWIFAPYHEFRASGRIHAQDPSSFGDIILRVGARIKLYLEGKAQKKVPDTRYKRVGRYGVWSLVEELGSNARLGMHRDEIHAFLSYRDVAFGHYAYSLGRTSQFVQFPIPKLLKALNKAEVHEWRGMVEEMPEQQVWAGSDLIAGGPRGGSLLDPAQVCEVINETLKK